MAYENAKSQSQKPPAREHDIASLPITREAAKKYGFDNTALSLILTQVVPESAKDQEIAMLLYHCNRTGLDPMARQIYLVYRGGKCTVQTAIDGYRLIAGRTGLYAGNSDPVYDDNLSQFAFLKTGSKTPTTATITVKKIVGGIVCDFTATAAWDAYYPGDAQGYMWKKMGMLMLAKCAEALALRKAFPAELSGIYVSEEMMQAGESIGDIEAEQVIKDLGVQNKNAFAVMSQLEKAELSPEDEELEIVVGAKLKDIEDTPEGTALLKKVWAFAVAYAKSKDKAAELDKLSKQL